MATIASRASWGARHKDGDLTLSGLAGEVFLHHTVTAQLSPSASVAEEQAQMRHLEAIGQSRFGHGISYNVVVFPSGRAYQGVSWNRRGTHTGGRNSTSRSIAFAGNTDVHHPTAAQIATARSIYHHGRGRWWTAAAPLRTHRDVSATACAGRHAIARLPEIRAGGAAPTPTPAPPTSGQLVVDGRWGSLTTRRVQQVLGTPVDGVVSAQTAAWRARNPGLTTGWDWTGRPGDGGSQMVAALQRLLGVTADGKIGPVTITALQRRMGTPADGVVSDNSLMVRALQTRLNEGRI